MFRRIFAIIWLTVLSLAMATAAMAQPSDAILIKVTVNGSDLAPQAPAGLEAIAGESRIDLTWTANSEEDLAGYNVYRSETLEGPYTKINQSLVVGLSSLVDTGLINGTTYYYEVTAVDNAGHESEYSAPLSAVPQDIIPPAVPSGLSAQLGDGFVDLSWTANTDADLARYNVYRAVASDGPYALLFGGVEPGFQDYDIVAGTTYFYEVTAVDTSENESQYSSPASILIPNAADSYEPNNTIDEAKSLDLGNTANATFYRNNDDDYYKVHLDNPGQVTVSLTDVPANITPYLTVFDSNQISIYSNSAAVGENLTASVDISQAGDYYLLVFDANGQYSTAPYSLRVDFNQVTDVYEPNNDFQQAASIDLNAAISAKLFGIGDRDYYKIYVNKPGEISVALTDIPSELSIEMYITDSAFQDLGYGSGSGDLTLTAYAQEAGDYYIELGDFTNGCSTSPYTLRANFIEISDVYEPNNDQTSAKTINAGEAVLASIYGAGDLDYYKIHLDKPGQVVASFTNTPDNIMPAIRVLDSGGGWVADGQGAVGQDFTFTADIAAAGDYYFEVSDCNWQYSTSPYTMRIDFSEGAYDTYEPNDDFERAALINLNQDVNATIYYSGDWDYYKVYIANPGEMEVSLTDVPENIAAEIMVYDQNMANIKDFYGSSGESLSSKVSISAPGDYYVRVQDINGGQYSTDKYHLKLTFSLVTDPYEPNDDWPAATPINFDQIVQAKIFGDGDVDYYKVIVDRPGVITAEVTGVPAEIAPAVTIYDNLQTCMASGMSSNGENLTVNADTVMMGEYYIAVTDAFGLSSTQPYDLKVTFTNDASDAYELNNDWSMAAPIDLGQDVSATIYNCGDWDYYKVHVDAPGSLTAQVSSVPSNITPSVEIYDSTMWNIYFGSGVTGQDFTAVADVPDSGDYYILVYDGNWAASTQPYNLKVTMGLSVYDVYEPNNVLPEAKPVDLNQTIQANIYGAGDMDYYRLYTDNGGVPTVTVSNVPANIQPIVEIYSDSMQSIGYAEAGAPGQSLTVAGDQPVMGDFYVVVSDYNGNYSVSNYSLNVVLDAGSYDSYEPNNDLTRAKSISLDQDVSATFYGGWDSDYYKIHIDRPGVAIASLTNVPLNVTAYMAIVDSQNQSIGGFSFGTAGESLEAAATISSAGDYYVYVGNYDEYSSTPYNLKVTFQDGGADVYEPNNDFSTAKAVNIGDTIQALIFGSGDFDYYKVHVNGPIILQAAMTDIDAVLSPEIGVFNSVHNWISWASDKTAQGILSVSKLPAAGDYYVKVSDWSNKWSLSPYTLSFSALTDPDTHEPNDTEAQATSINLGDNAQGYLAYSRDYDFYKIHANAPTAVKVVVTNVPAEITPSIYMHQTASGSMNTIDTTGQRGEDLSVYAYLYSAGDYYLYLTDRGGAFSPSPYQISVVVYNWLVDFSVSSPAFSPNSDGSQDTVGISARLAAAGNYAIAVKNSAGQTLRTFTGASNGVMVSATWDGKDSGGAVVPEGTYYIDFSDNQYPAAERIGQVIVDVTAPTVLSSGPAANSELSGAVYADGVAGDLNFKGDYYYSGWKYASYVAYGAGTNPTAWIRINGVYNGSLRKSDFVGLGLDVDALFADLMANGYIDTNYVVLDTFRRISGPSDMILSPAFESQREMIYAFVNRCRSTYFGSWDTTTVNNGSYAIRVHIEDWAGNITNRDVPVTVYNPITLRNPGISVNPFSPNADAVKDTTAISAVTNSPCDYTVVIKDAYSQDLRTFTGHAAGPGTFSAVWDGKNSSGAVVSDGVYTFYINTADGRTVSSQVSGTVTVDNTLPVAAITSPTANQVVWSKFDVIGTARDANFKSYSLQFGAGAAPAVWSDLGSSASQVIANKFASWDTVSKNGIYTIKLAAEDNAGNKAVTQVQINIDNIKVTGVSVSPKFFNPAISQITRLSYTLDKPANVTIDLYRVYATVGNWGDMDYQRVVVRRLVDNAAMPSGQNSYDWDGKDASGKVMQASAYSYSIKAGDADGRNTLWDPAYVSGAATISNKSLVPANYDPFKNENLAINYSVSLPSWITIGVEWPADIGGYILSAQPRDAGSNSDIWDGRSSVGAILTSGFQVSIKSKILPEIVSVIRDDGLNITNIKTEAYKIIPSYAQISTIAYEITRNADVTIKMIAPNGDNWVLVQYTDQTAGANTYEWHGSDAQGRMVSQEGNYRVEITAVDPATSFSVTRTANITVYK